MAFLKASSAVVGTADSSAEDAALARGVRYRVVMERRMRDEVPGLYAEVARVVDAGEEVRIAGEVPLKLVIVDREFAYLPVKGPAEIATAGALLVHRSGLLDALVALFETVWATANRVLTSARSLAGTEPLASREPLDDRLDDRLDTAWMTPWMTPWMTSTRRSSACCSRV